MFDKLTERDNLIVKVLNLQIVAFCYSTLILNFLLQDKTLRRALKNKKDKKNKNINIMNLSLFFKTLKHAILDKVINVLFKATITLFIQLLRNKR